VLVLGETEKVDSFPLSICCSEMSSVSSAFIKRAY
jgi:hypothetical protein